MRADRFIRMRWLPWFWELLDDGLWFLAVLSDGARVCLVTVRLLSQMLALSGRLIHEQELKGQGCTTSDMFISRWHTGCKGHHQSDILKWNNNIYVQIVSWWDHVETVLIKLAYKWLPIYRQLKMPRLCTKCFLLTLSPSKYEWAKAGLGGGGGEGEGVASLTVGSAYLVLMSWVIYFIFFHPRNVLSCVCSETSPAVITALKEFGFRYVNIIAFNFFTINWVSGET